MISLHLHPYAPFLDRVSKPTRYTGSEYGIRSKPWDEVQARVCLAFPDLYDIGMSHLGYRILYQLLNDDPRMLAERCYTPWTDVIAELRARDLPLVSLESARRLAEFDVVGFSLQFELTYTNVLLMLDLGGIPLRAAARDEAAPLILAGGPVATHAEPLAPFVDAFLIGDGEEATGEIVLCWTEARRRGFSRRQRLEALAAIEGVYVPSLYETTLDPASKLEVVEPGRSSEVAPFPVRRRVVSDLARFPFPTGGPVGGPEAVFDRLSVEIARGCTEGCRFCQAGMIYRPLREREPRQVIETVLAAVTETGQDEVSLTALSTADVSAIAPLIKSLARETTPRRVSLGVASLRAYGLDDDVLDAMSQVRASGLTFAPEAGTQRLRDVINKNVTEAQLLETAERVFARGHDKMKLYFILGLPTETDEDVQAIAQVARSALAVGKRRGPRATVTISASNHVPKPHTPFQWCAMEPEAELERRQLLLRGAVRGIRGLSLKTHDAPTSVLEGVLARGDRRLATVLEHAYRGGACFDAWEDQLRLDLWQSAFGAAGIDPARYLEALPITARLPWDHLDVGLAPGFLAREYARALRGQKTPPCGKVAHQLVHATNAVDALAETGRLVCHHCGLGCDLERMRAERLEFLRRLDGFGHTDQAAPPQAAPPQAAPPQAATAPAPATATTVNARRRHPEQHRVPQPGETVTRWRLRYAKLGPLALLGHLDLIRELGRVFRRAGVTVAYTTGFHPKPAMSFSPALPLGMPSLGEYLDVKLIDAPTAATLLAALERATPPGLRFSGAAALEPGDPGLAAVIDAAAYVVAVGERSLEAIGGEGRFEALLRDFGDRPLPAVERLHKGRTRRFALGDEVLVLQRASPADHAALLEAEEPAAPAALYLELRLGPAGGLRPAELLAALSAELSQGTRVVRLGLRAGPGCPLDLERLRCSATRPDPATTGLPDGPSPPVRAEVPERLAE